MTAKYDRFLLGGFHNTCGKPSILQKTENSEHTSVLSQWNKVCSYSMPNAAFVKCIQVLNIWPNLQPQ